MEIERLKRANKVKNEIDLHKEAVRLLENGGEIFVEEKIGLSRQHQAILADDWERRLIIHNKKQRIQALEKELEAI